MEEEAFEKAERFLEDNMKVRLKEKEEYGEVFTPIGIIDEMLESLPKSVWSDPDKIWVDPACGFANFFIKVIKGGEKYPGLFKGLQSKISDPAERIKHILEKMLYLYDINKESVKKASELLKSFSPHQAVKLNISTESFLESVIPEADIIVGNPPYNAGGLGIEGTKRLHIAFTEHSLKYLKPDGYLLFVCPPNYREEGSEMNMLFRNYKGSFKYIHMFGADEVMRVFNVSTRIDIFLFRLGKHSDTTHVIDEYGIGGDFDIDLTKHVPNFGLSVFDKIRKHGTLTIDAFRTSEMTTNNCDDLPFSKTGKHKIIHLINKDGFRVYKSKKAHSLQKLPKILLNGVGYSYVYYDEKGEYGVTQVPVVILNPSKKLAKFCQSSFFQFIISALRFTKTNNLPYMFTDIPSDYGEGLKLTTEEKNLISRFKELKFEKRNKYETCNKTRKLKDRSGSKTRKSTRT